MHFWFDKFKKLYFNQDNTKTINLFKTKLFQLAQQFLRLQRWNFSFSGQLFHYRKKFGFSGIDECQIFYVGNKNTANLNLEFRIKIWNQIKTSLFSWRIQHKSLTELFSDHLLNFSWTSSPKTQKDILISKMCFWIFCDHFCFWQNFERPMKRNSSKKYKPKKNPSTYLKNLEQKRCSSFHLFTLCKLAMMNQKPLQKTPPIWTKISIKKFEPINTAFLWRD